MVGVVVRSFPNLFRTIICHSTTKHSIHTHTVGKARLNFSRTEVQNNARWRSTSSSSPASAPSLMQSSASYSHNRSVNAMFILIVPLFCSFVLRCQFFFSFLFPYSLALIFVLKNVDHHGLPVDHAAAADVLYSEPLVNRQ